MVSCIAVWSPSFIKEQHNITSLSIKAVCRRQTTPAESLAHWRLVLCLRLLVKWPVDEEDLNTTITLLGEGLAFLSNLQLKLLHKSWWYAYQIKLRTIISLLSCGSACYVAVTTARNFSTWLLLLHTYTCTRFFHVDIPKEIHTSAE